MRMIVVLNSELDEPYCYERLDENGDWVGVGPYDPEKVIPGEVAITEDGYVYTYQNGRLGDTYIDEQEWEDWERMLGDPDYPSARMVEE